MATSEYSYGVQAEICIPVYNEASTIDSVLACVQSQRGITIPRITVCANGCSDETCLVVRRVARRDHRLRVIEVPWRSKARAWQTMLHAAETEFVLFLDGDIAIDPTVASRLVTLLATHPKLVVASAMPCPVRARSHGIDRLFVTAAGPREPSGIVGACYAARTDAIRALVGGTRWGRMPPDLIAEDRWLTELLGPSRWRPVPGCDVWYYTAAARDLLANAMRHQRARRQREVRYRVAAAPPSSPAAVGDRLTRIAAALLREWRSRRSVVWLARRILAALAVRAIGLVARFRVTFCRPATGPPPWDRTPSTKRPVRVGALL